MNNIQLVALDLDGTLLNNQGQITSPCREAIRRAGESGVYVVISTGRPYCGIPLEQIAGTGIRYGITTNGSGIYDLNNGSCIYENSMDTDFILPILKYLITKDIHMDAFIEGQAYSPLKCLEVAKKLDMPPSLKKYVIDTRIRKEDLEGFIRENQLSVQKMTLNFYPLPDGTLKDREEIKEYLMSNPALQCVSGGYNNLEFTKAGITKGNGLKELARYLNIPMEHTMAVGDTENDLSIIETAAVGVAMGNATLDVKRLADHITASNEEDGVAKVISDFILS